MAKYNEYREKAVRLDLLTEILTSAHIKVRMIHLGGIEYRLTRNDDGTHTIEPLRRELSHG